jgi:hypothetical protein
VPRHLSGNMRWLWLLAVIGCGGPGESGAWGAGECSLRCERSKGALVQDFGVSGPISCWDSELYLASERECGCIFVRRWGVVVVPLSCSAGGR